MSEQLRLPENAYKELASGEIYTPVVSNENAPEVTVWSVVFGVLMIILFSAAASFISLKLGQGIETAIPIGILAVGMAAILKKKNALLQNVNILAIGATSGIIVGGTCFVMPAIFILGLDKSNSSTFTFFQLAFMPLLGAILGVLLLIPFRRYFTTEMHGKLPFPEARATVEILMSGEAGGSSQAKILVGFTTLGLLLDYIAMSVKLWSDTFTTEAIGLLSPITTKAKMVFSMGTASAYIGMGMLIGVKFASIIMAGSALIYFVVVPIVGHFDPAHAGLEVGQIFNNFTPKDEATVYGVRNMGIGGLFAAGLISIFSMRKVIKDALSQVLAQVTKGSGEHAEVSTSRLDRDVPMKQMIIIGLIITAGMFIFLYSTALANEKQAFWLSMVGVAIILIMSFLFAAVSAWAIATISVTPISGMTLTAIIISAVLLLALGLTGANGMLAVLLIGVVICTSLSMCGSLVTQFKIAELLGATPKKIQWSNIIGGLLATLTVAASIMLFNHVFGFGNPTELHPNPMPAPQASAMAASVQALMSGGQSAPWLYYGIGAAIAILAKIFKVSPLAFALGMFLPMELNSPILVGAILGWFINRSAGDNKSVIKAREQLGTVIASGLIAGGALAGVFTGLGKMINIDIAVEIPGSLANWLGLIVFLSLCAVVYAVATRAKPEPIE